MGRWQPPPPLCFYRFSLKYTTSPGPLAPQNSPKIGFCTVPRAERLQTGGKCGKNLVFCGFSLLLAYFLCKGAKWHSSLVCLLEAAYSRQRPQTTFLGSVWFNSALI